MNMVEYDSGPHREMAVDVPDSFIPRNKTPPRYPPTSKSATMTSSLSNNNKGPHKSLSSGGRAGNGSTTTLPGHSTTQNGAPGSKPIPPPRINEKDGWSVNNNNTQAPHVPPRTLLSPNKSAEVSPSTDQADRIKKYQVKYFFLLYPYYCQLLQYMYLLSIPKVGRRLSYTRRNNAPTCLS